MIRKTVRYVKRHQIALLGTATAATVIVFQHKCIVEALDLLNENGIEIGKKK